LFIEFFNEGFIVGYWAFKDLFAENGL